MHAKTLTIVLAGGAGRRLHPLTANRAKPAVPFGGKYRIIDFTLSNCLHSGLRRILVLTQYKSHSLMSTHALASMGIYVFPLAGLCAILREDHDLAGSSHDFGKDILPRLIRIHEVYAYQFGGIQGRVTQDRYWRDVGTLDTYYEANMDLLLPHPPIDLYQEDFGPYGATSDLTRLPARCPAGPGGRRNWPTRSRLRERSLPAPRYVTRFSSPMCV